MSSIHSLKKRKNVDDQNYKLQHEPLKFNANANQNIEKT